MECSYYRGPITLLVSASAFVDIVLIYKVATDFANWDNLFLLAAAIFWAAITVGHGYSYPCVLLCDEGVRVRRFFRTTQYAWQDFIQVGTARGVKWTQRIVYDGTVYMLLPGAVKHDPNEDFEYLDDDFFLMRNFSRIFAIPMEEKTLHIIQKNYGDLDFAVTMYYRSWHKN